MYNLSQILEHSNETVRAASPDCDSSEPWALYALVLVLPFEPSRLFLRWAGLEFTFLELGAGAALVATAASIVRQGRLVEVARSPLVRAAFLFLVACLVSAATAEPPRILPFKFTLRVLAGVVALSLAAATKGERAVERVLRMVAAAGALSALIGLADVVGIPGAAALTALFHPQAFQVGDAPRLSATFAYPNGAAGFWLFSLVSAVFLGLRTERRAVRYLSALLAAVVFVALILTYSRGALLGAAAASAVLWVCTSGRERGWLTRVLAGGVVVAATFFVASRSFRMRGLDSSGAEWYRARILPESSELRLAPDEGRKTGVVLENKGTESWEASGELALALSYRWYDRSSRKLLDGPFVRTPLPRNVRPGDSVGVVAEVRAPDREGSFLLVWELTREGTTPFVEKEGLEQYVSIAVGGGAERGQTVADAIADFVAGSWRPGRLELWTLAARLFWSHPLLGVGPDNFRWRYGGLASRERWDTRTSANSLYLEILATTGLLGGASFAWLIWVVGRALLPLAREKGGSGPSGPSGLAAATLAAGLTGFLAHGAFDYLLSFTPLYLLFWIWLGIARAARA